MIDLIILACVLTPVCIVGLIFDAKPGDVEGERIQMEKGLAMLHWMILGWPLTLYTSFGAWLGVAATYGEGASQAFHNGPLGDLTFAALWGIGYNLRNTLRRAPSPSGTHAAIPDEDEDSEPDTPTEGQELVDPIDAAPSIIETFLQENNLDQIEELIHAPSDLAPDVINTLTPVGTTDIGGHMTTVEGRNIPVRSLADAQKLLARFSGGGGSKPPSDSVEADHDSPPAIVSITMRYATPIAMNRLRQAGYNVRGGRGVPSFLTDNIVRLDLIRTRVSCAIQVAVLHAMLWTGKFATYNTHRELKDAYSVLLKRLVTCYVPMHWCTDDIQSILAKLSMFSPDLVVYQYHEGNTADEQIAYSLQASDFSPNVLHVWITTGNHAQLLFPLERLSEAWQWRILDETKRTWYQRIRKPKPKSEAYEHINTLDTEAVIGADGVSTTGLLCGIYNGERIPAFKSTNAVRDFIVWFIALGVSAEFWVHNLSYDGRFFFEAILPYVQNMLDRPVEVLSNKQGFISLRFHLINGCTLRLRCSVRHLPQSLRALCKSILPDRPDLWKHDFNVLQCKSVEQLWSTECVEYCYADCEALLHILTRHQDKAVHKYGMNPLRYASASSYAKANWYVHGYDPEKYPLVTHSEQTDASIRAGYNGGRVEVFMRGIFNGVFKLLDFNSCFPAAMCGDMPYGYPTHKTSINSNVNVKSYLTANPGMYTIMILHQPKLVFNLFPLKTHNGLEFPYLKQGDYVPMQDYETLLYALTLGYRFKLVEGYTFQYANYMETWVKDMYKDKSDSKKAKDSVAEAIAKLVLNSCYGCFGTNPDTVNLACYGSRSVHGCLNNTLRGGAIGEVHNNMWFGYERDKAIFADTNVAVASTITSRARLALYQHMVAFETAGYKVMYCDTDSLLVRMPDECVSFPPALASLIDPLQLGMLKDETAAIAPDNYIREAILVTAKGYSIQDSKGNITAKLKGCNKKYLGYDFASETDLDAIDVPIDDPIVQHRKNVRLREKLIQMANGETVAFEMRKMYKEKRTLFTSHCITNRIITSRPTGVYKKGIVGPDGTVTPNTYNAVSLPINVDVIR